MAEDALARLLLDNPHKASYLQLKKVDITKKLRPQGTTAPA